MILVIDNYDSFVHNLARYIRELGWPTRVERNDGIDLAGIAQLRPTHIVISPGPCTPNESGISVAVVQQFGPAVPILGVCLGHQCIAQAFGGRIVRAGRPMHGKTSTIDHDGRGIFRGVPNPFRATRYHSLVAAADSMPDTLEITAHSEDGEIMALRHREYPIVGVQFHPEAVLTEHGYSLLGNFLEGADMPATAA